MNKESFSHLAPCLSAFIPMAACRLFGSCIFRQYMVVKWWEFRILPPVFLSTLQGITTIQLQKNTTYPFLFSRDHDLMKILFSFYFQWIHGRQANADHE